MEKLKEKDTTFKQKEPNDEVIDKIENDQLSGKENIKKRKFTIMGFTIWRIIIYFMIYSFLGFVAETLFGLITKGVLESRKNFLYGPFCCIYGVGALVVILGLQKFKKNTWYIRMG